MRRYPFAHHVFAVVFVLGLLSAASRPGVADPIDDHIVAQVDKVDVYLAGKMKTGHLPGLSLAVVREGRPLLVRHYGLANVEWSVPVAADTVYQIASITKQFTATAVMMLVEEGKLGLDDTIRTHLSDLPEAWSPVTVRHLLTHTSGIKSYTDVSAFWKTSRQEISKRDLIKLVASSPLQFEPGTRWAYSNTGYFLLGMLIEQLSAKSYAAFLTERILQPLEMRNTRVNSLQEVIPRRASGYSWTGTRLMNGDYTSPSGPYAAGALISSVEDLAKWTSALNTERLLKRSSLELMWTPQNLKNGTSTGYGFGWVVTNHGKPNKVVGHAGGIPGFTSYIGRYLERQVTVILLTNGDADTPSLSDSVYRTLTKDLPPAAP